MGRPTNDAERLQLLDDYLADLKSVLAGGLAYKKPGPTPNGGVLVCEIPIAGGKRRFYEVDSQGSPLAVETRDEAGDEVRAADDDQVVEETNAGG